MLHHYVPVSIRALNMTTVFTSWKEIAEYLGKGVRTAQRWEQEAGLPVRRQNGEGRGKVLAFASEIDEWKHSATADDGDESERLQLLAGVEQLLTENEDIRRKLNAVRQGSSGLTDILSGSDESLFSRCTLLLTDNAPNRRRFRDLIETQSSLTQASAKAPKTSHPSAPMSSRTLRRNDSRR
jgi:predicted DNA-binding transcriptional regulator AlpA